MQKTAPLLLALLVAPAFAVLLRGPAKPADIKAKWDNMDEFLETMFIMACKMKNGKDINGLAAEKLKNGEVDGAAGYAQEVTKLQAANVRGLERSCGFIIADGKKACREGCATRWNANTAGPREDCDEKCVKVYTNFERSCKSKADNLVKVYAQKSEKAAAQKQCYEGHCKEFPMVWMKSGTGVMKTEVHKQCSARCSDKNVKLGCQTKWATGVDFITASVTSKCQDASGVSKCFAKKKKAASTVYAKCQKDEKAKCSKAKAACEKKGKTDKTFKDAAKFCSDRLKMCQGQADKNCLDSNKAAIDKGESDCNNEAATALATCKDAALKKQEAAALKKCIKESATKCYADCSGKCQVDKMDGCLKMLNKDDSGKMFCTDFWQLLHASAETDPITGNPIALLSQKAQKAARITLD